VIGFILINVFNTQTQY